jgi:outer membrane cobalamin receptor
MMTKKRLFIFCILFILVVSCVPSKSLSKNKEPKTIDETLVNVSLLDRLRMYSGIVTRGQGQNAQVFIRGIAGVNTPKEVLFIVNGTQVGNYSRALYSLNPVEITNIRLLKKAIEIAPYGFAGSGGVVLITTK